MAEANPQDFYGNNAAFRCGCGKIFVVSGLLHGPGLPRGERACPACGEWIGRVMGSANKGGSAILTPAHAVES